MTNIDSSVIEIRVCCLLHGRNICGVLFKVFFFFLLWEAVALTGSVATEPVRVGGVCLHFFTWDLITI